MDFPFKISNMKAGSICYINGLRCVSYIYIVRLHPCSFVSSRQPVKMHDVTIKRVSSVYTGSRT